MIKCPYFEKKLKGINGLVEILERKKLVLDNELLLKWSKEVKLFETLFK